MQSGHPLVREALIPVRGRKLGTRPTRETNGPYVREALIPVRGRKLKEKNNFLVLFWFKSERL